MPSDTRREPSLNGIHFLLRVASQWPTKIEVRLLYAAGLRILYSDEPLFAGFVIFVVVVAAWDLRSDPVALLVFPRLPSLRQVGNFQDLGGNHGQALQAN